MTLTPEKLQILQHSLGCDQYGQTSYQGRDEGDGCSKYYRNRFVTGPGGADFEECSALAAAGLMQNHGPRALCGGAYYFSVTTLGVEVMLEASPKPPKLTPAQCRYRQFLEEDSGLKFGEWLGLLKRRPKK